jgi:sigma-B regulation protein RsbU (phosphoserine phosphatase)
LLTKEPDKDVVMSTEIRDTLRFLQQENIRLQKENQQLQDEVVVLRDVLEALRSLQDISANISADTNVLQLLDRILQAALISIDASDGSLLLVDHETSELAFVVVYGAVRDSLRGHRMPIGTGIAGWVAQNAQPTIIPNARLDPRFSADVDQSFQFQTRSILCVPIISDGKVLGVIQALNKADGQEFKRGDLTLMGVVSQLAATAIAKAEAATLTEEVGE